MNDLPATLHRRRRARHRGLGWAVACAALAAGTAGCGSGAVAGGAAATEAPGSAPGHRLSLPAPRATVVRETDQLLFEPGWVGIRAGGTVEWVNASSVVHNVTFDAPAITSPTMNPGNRYAVRFTRPGTYLYRCTFHVPSMIGTVVVGD
jgi:plastocyanin